MRRFQWPVLGLVGLLVFPSQAWANAGTPLRWVGDDQICGFDPVKRRVTLLWRGRGPVAVIGKRGMETGNWNLGAGAAPRGGTRPTDGSCQLPDSGMKDG
jgi:hypothetical protein